MEVLTMLPESSIVCVCLAMVGGRLLCLGLNLLSPFTDSHGFLHSPLIDIVDGDDKLAVPDLAVRPQAAEMNMEFPDGIPGIADHLVNDIIECGLGYVFRDQIDDCFQPVELIAV